MKFQGNDASGLGYSLTQLTAWFGTWSLNGLQVTYYSSDSAPSLPGFVAVGGADFTGNMRVAKVDSSGRFYVVSTPGGGTSNVAIVSPVDGSGYVEIDIKANGANLAQEAGGNLAFIQNIYSIIYNATATALTVTPVDPQSGLPFTKQIGQPAPLAAVLMGVSDGTTLRALAGDSSGQAKVLVENTPTVTISGTPNVAITSPVDGSGYVEVDVKTIGTVNTIDQNLLNTIAATGTAVPSKSVQIGGSDGADIRTLATDAGGQAKVLVENTPSVTVSGTPNVAITSPVDGSGYVEVDVKTIGTVNTIDQNLLNTIAATGAAVPSKSVQIAGSDGTDIRTLATDAGGQAKVLVENTPAVTISGTPAVTQTPGNNSYPTGATPVLASANGGNVSLTASMPAVGGKTNYVAGVFVSADGSTAGATSYVQLTGLVGGTITIGVITFPAGALLAAQPIYIQFNPPIPASAVNTAIGLTNNTAAGSGNSKTNLFLWGYVI